MEDDQQFCLRWNNHQSTLIQNFDTLLESGTLVDCTLAAEGKYLKAHKVVLSACSPYFEGLLSEHYDKHPVFILKDVKFKELKAMMEYMYRGEVNISQEQLTALLKAAESLQIKGLSDNRTGGASSTSSTTTSKAENTRSTKQAATATASSAVAASASTTAADIPPHASSGLTIEKNSKVPRSSLSQVSVSDLPDGSVSPQLRGLSSREGSQSPTRRRKRTRRRSLGNEDTTTGSIDNHDASNSSDVNLTAPTLVAPVAEDKSHADQADPIGRSALMQQLTKPPTEEMMQMSHEKAEPTEEMIQPKSEYMDDQESVEDLTNLDDDMNDLELDGQESTRPGPSHDPSQHGGVQPWHMGGDRSNPGVAAAIPPGQQDEVFLAAHDAAQAQRDSQGGDMLVIQNVIGGFAAGYEWDESLFEFLNSTDFRETSYPGLDFNLEEEKKFKIQLKKQCRLKRLMQHYCMDCQQLSDITSSKYYRAGKKCENNGCNGILHYKCIECGKMFKEISSAYKHLRDLCNKQDKVHTKPVPRLTRDVRYNPYNKDGSIEACNFPCSKCDRKFSTLKGRLCHEKRYCKNMTSNLIWRETSSDNLMGPASAPTGNVSCPKCDERFLTTKGLKVHIYRIHHGTILKSSDSCPKPLTKNVITEISAPKSNFSCPKCIRNFLTLKGLKIHMSHRCDKSEVSSDLSPKAATENVNNQVSIQLSNFTCPKCDKLFSTLKGLKIHMSRECIKNEEPRVFSPSSQLKDTIKIEPNSSTKSDFTCLKCDRNFLTSKGLKIHTSHRCGRSEEFSDFHPKAAAETLNNQIPSKSDFPCLKCNQNFLTLKGLKIHTSHRCGKSEVSGDLCPKPPTENVNNQVSVQQNNLTCPKCEKNFSTPKGLKIHMSRECIKSEEPKDVSPSPQLTDTIKIEPTCLKDDQNFLTSEGLEMHMGLQCDKSEDASTESQNTIKIEPFPCTKCDRIFQSIYGLRSHLSQCGKIVKKKRASQFSFRKVSQKTINNLVCPRCSKKCAGIIGLKLHMNRYCSGQSSKVSSDTCSPTSVATNELIRQRSFVCLDCQQTFSSINAMRCHVNFHCKNMKTLNTTTCEKCYHKFESVKRLRLHRHFCPISVKNFNMDRTDPPDPSDSSRIDESSNDDPAMQIDKQVDSIENQPLWKRDRTGAPHVCTKCQRSFTNNRSLNVHKNSCNLEMNLHKCKNCAFKSKTSFGLNVHLKRVHLRSHAACRLSCPLCNYQSNYKHNLILHKKQCHPDNEIVKALDDHAYSK